MRWVAFDFGSKARGRKRQGEENKTSLHPTARPGEEEEEETVPPQNNTVSSLKKKRMKRRCFA
jgi:hypothetical protein